MKRKAKSDLNTKKKITKIVQSVINKEIETKSGYATSIGGSFIEGTPKTWNLMYQVGMAYGSTADNSQRIGDQVLLTGISYRGRLRSSLTSNVPTNFTLAIVKTPIYRTTTNLALNEMMPDYDLTTFPLRFDSKKIQVIKRMDIKLKPTVAGAFDCTEVHFKKFFKKPVQIKFNEVAGFQLKDWNYYLVIGGSQYGATLGTTVVGDAFGTIEIFYKDP